MQLDKFSDYALRVLMVLTVKHPETVSVRQVSRMFEISENHVAKIATALVREGFVVSQRGRAGGLTLAKSPKQITVGAVLRTIKEANPVVECFGPQSSCKILPACGLRAPLQIAQEAFFATLDAYTLEDITAQRDRLRDLIA